MKPTDWLLAHLIRAGYLTETGLSRRARLIACSRCKAVVMSGLDADVCAFEVECEPRPLTSVGEAVAWIEGRRTWSLTKARGGRFELDPRDARSIAKTPAGTGQRLDVLAEHVCRVELVSDLGATYGPSSFPEIAPHMPPGSPAPF